MKHDYQSFGKSRFWGKPLLLFLFLITFQISSVAQSNNQLRRPISPDQPMWLVHIDTWNYADPQKIIDLIPEDIRPFVVMNIALSISHDEDDRFKVAEYGYEIAKSWLRTCAQNQMWAVVQLASGGYAQFSDFDLTVYEELYQEFPNLIGFSYAEQFWGFGDSESQFSPTWPERITHFANLLELSNKYGGYLVVSWCGNQWSANINPIAMLKRIPKFAEASSKYTENYILCEKYTQQSYILDMESICLGTYLSGFSGQYGIRYDDTGWSDQYGEHENFTLATGGAAHLEHIMLTGQTVIDAPELIWTQCFRELNPAGTTGGYTERQWGTFPQFDNFSIDLFRKVLDGTVRIPSRQEVIDRTKVVVVNDQNSGTSDEVYSSPETLFEGLYRMDGDGNLRDNKTFFKKTGRYPTIPTVYQLEDAVANTFDVEVNTTDYSSRWPNISSKVNELNNLFPEEYTGDIYAGRHENGWVTYNPYKTGQTASGSIPFKYNTCERVELTYAQYTSGVMKEYTDRLTFYLTNYDERSPSTLKTDEIKIYGSSSKPTFSYTDRANHAPSSVSENWADGVYTLTVQHNGPIDITVNCSGSASERLTSYTEASIATPKKPALYTGPRQYEAECFDYKNINRIIKGGYNYSIRNYTGQGYLQLGTSSSAAVRDTVTALRAGKYKLITKYSVSGGDVNTLDLYVNGSKISTPTFTKTATESDWAYLEQTVELSAGKNAIEFRANAGSSYSLNFDNFVITQGESNGVYHFQNDQSSLAATTPPAELVTIQSGSAGVVAYTNSNDETTNAFKTYSAGETNGTGVVDLDMFPETADNYSVTWEEYYDTAGGKKGLLLRGNTVLSAYADGMKQGYLFTVLNNEDNTVTLESNVANAGGLLAKTSYTSGFAVLPGEPCWYRATVVDNQMVFECSKDSLNWEGGDVTAFTDDNYLLGSTQLVWGFNTDNYSWVMDNIRYSTGNLSVSKVELAAFRYEQGKGPSESQSFKVTGSSLTGDILITVPAGFEVSLSENSDYNSSLTITPVNGEAASQTVYVRMKAGLSMGTRSGDIHISSEAVADRLLSVSGEVLPQPTSVIYNFSNDVATTVAQTPPALNTAIPLSNGATAGVVSYTDANGLTSNALKPYSGGNRNATGVIDLNLFSQTGTDYSVTWKQSVGSSGTDYKVGMLMRGDVDNRGSASTGYVQGLMEGYLLLVYTAGGSSHSEFRVYKSTSGYNTLSTLVNQSANALVPTAGQPIWYRASVSGTSPVSLQIEYSKDSITWETGAAVTDASSVFTSGATQLVWGLGVSSVDFYVDNIEFYGLDENSANLKDLIEVSASNLDGFSYEKGSGPSDAQFFSVSASDISEDLELGVSANYEISLSTDGTYSSSVSLSPMDNTVNEITVYIRLKSGLEIGDYNGEISVSSPGFVTKYIALTGTVEVPTGIGDLPVGSSATVVSTEYYSITGQRVINKPQISGIYIVRTLMSDDSVVVSKKYIDVYNR
ncbi:glycoside hydrolase family 98 domain-containing protein [uncultured Draconibacterium sp.]|uniref:glycoside hydrolase family 98 domain-containing protein n=1 Tax=uncultured Draconibacterium sp. TaxID=1573823 RepID=UPI0025F17E3B|nr:glycoside hydrolase family 98 domain-containing protein [uncultured Draconibacterium sp.]